MMTKHMHVLTSTFTNLHVLTNTYKFQEKNVKCKDGSLNMQLLQGQMKVIIFLVIVCQYCNTLEDC